MDITVLTLHIHKVSPPLMHARYCTKRGSSQLLTGYQITLSLLAFVRDLMDRQNVTAQTLNLQLLSESSSSSVCTLYTNKLLHLNQNPQLANVSETIPTEKRKILKQHGFRGRWSEIVQSVQRVATGWSARGSNLVEGEIFCTRPHWPWELMDTRYISRGKTISTEHRG